MCSTTGSTPFRLNLNVGDVGHTLVLGPTGAGKSTLLSMLALQWLRYPDAQVVIFDKDRSARSATLAAEGEYYEPAANDESLSFQPLSSIDDQASGSGCRVCAALAEGAACRRNACNQEGN